MASKKLRSYTVMANLFVTVEAAVRAESFQDASIQAKALEVSDFIKNPLADCRPPEIVSIYLDDSGLPD